MTDSRASRLLLVMFALVALAALAFAACDDGQDEEGKTPTATPTPVPPTATLTPPVEGVKLLFAYSPGCPHCAYQRPIITEYEEEHPEVDVTWVRYSDLNGEQRSLLEGTSGHPVMVFYRGDVIRQVVGETSIGALEEEHEVFKIELKKTERSKTTTGSGIKCP